MDSTKCLSEKTIQFFLDNELDKVKRISVMQHLETCSFCSESVLAQREWANLVKTSVRISNSTSGNPIDLQGIKLRKKGHWSVIFIFPYLAKIAALVIIVFGSYWYFMAKEDNSYIPTDQELLLWEQQTMGDDANQIWHDRMISAVETNAGGEVLQIDIY